MASTRAKQYGQRGASAGTGASIILSMTPNNKIKFDLEGCEGKIRSACASEISQRDWCRIWAKALADALKGRTALFAMLLPIVARKMPESLPPKDLQPFSSSDVPVQLLGKINGESVPNVDSH